MKLLKKISHKKFTLILLGGVVFTLLLSFCIFQFDLSYSDNDVIRRYQIAKLEDNVPIETLIVGDSSAGNALDADYFSKLSHQKTKNVALTGSFGLAGTFEIMNEALQNNPDIKNIVIMHTLDIWRRPFAKEGIFELNRGQHLNFWSSYFSRSPFLEYLEYATQFKNIFRFCRSVLEHTPLKAFIPEKSQIILIDKEHDYLRQESKTYANGERTLKGNEKLSSIIDQKNLDVVYMIDDWCGVHHIRCIYLHGPVHKGVFQNSLSEVDAIHTALKNTQHMRVLNQVFFYENSKMGDSINHIAVPFKKELTQEYFEAVQGYLTPVDPS